MAAAVAATSIGCGDDDSDGAAGSSPTPTGGSTGTAGSGGSPDGGGGSSGVGGPSTKGGWIAASSATGIYGAGGNALVFSHSTLGARFRLDYTEAFPPASCSNTELGDCFLLECPIGLGSGGADGSVFPTAGNITVTGGYQPIVNLIPDANGLYASPDINKDHVMYHPSTTLNISAAGAEVPSFTDTLTTPAAVVVTAPAIDGANQVTIDTSGDLSVSWTGGGAGEKMMVALFGKVTGTDSSYTLTCKFDSTAGTGTVPATLLSALASVDKDGLIMAYGHTTKEIIAGQWTIEVRTSEFATSPSGGLITNTVNYQ